MKSNSFFFICISLFFISACNTNPNKLSTATTTTTTTTTTTAEKVATSNSYQIGEVANDFSLKNIDGNMFSLADIKDAKGYIITFTCNHCPYAVMYEDRLIDLHSRYAPQGYPVIAINPNDPEVAAGDSFEGMVERAKEKSFNFPYLFDEGQKIYPLFGATRTPHIFILDKDRKVRYIGAIDDNHEDADAVKVKYVENAIAALEKGVDPEPAITKAIGCTIKVKKSK